MFDLKHVHKDVVSIYFQKVVDMA